MRVPWNCISVTGRGSPPVAEGTVAMELGAASSRPTARLSALIAEAVAAIEGPDGIGVVLSSGAQYTARGGRELLPRGEEWIEFPLSPLATATVEYRAAANGNWTPVADVAAEENIISAPTWPDPALVQDRPLVVRIVATTPDPYSPPEDLTGLITEIVRDRLLYQELKKPYPGHSAYVLETLDKYRRGRFA